jgi:hypothetical protein
MLQECGYEIGELVKPHRIAGNSVSLLNKHFGNNRWVRELLVNDFEVEIVEVPDEISCL